MRDQLRHCFMSNNYFMQKTLSEFKRHSFTEFAALTVIDGLGNELSIHTIPISYISLSKIVDSPLNA